LVERQIAMLATRESTMFEPVETGGLPVLATPPFRCKPTAVR
jgi:hypothetical protein